MLSLPDEGPPKFWKEFEEDLTATLQNGPARPSPGDKGIQIDQSFRRVGDEVFNTDPLSFRTYDKMRTKDDQIVSGLDLINNSVLGKGGQFVGGQETNHLTFIEDMYEPLNLMHIFSDVLLALPLGFSVMEKVFEQREDGMVIINRYKGLPQKTITFLMTPQGKEIRVEQDSIRRVRNKRIRLPLNKVNIFRFKSENGEPYGTPILKGIHQSWAIKEWIIRYRNIFAERMAGGFLVVKTGAGQTVKARQEVEKGRATSVIALQRDMELDVHFPPAKGDIYNRIIDYCNSQINKGLLTPDLLIGQNTEFGSRALSETQFASFKLTRIHKLQNDLKRWIDRDIKQIIDINFGPQDSYPGFVFNAWSIMELEQLANYYRKLAEIQIIGTNDVEKIRESLELWDVPPEGVGDPLPVQVQDERDPKEPRTSGGEAGDAADDIPPPSEENVSVG